MVKSLFCPNCDGILVLNTKKKRKNQPITALVCMDCDYVLLDENTVKKSMVISQTIDHSDHAGIEIIEESAEIAITEDLREELTEQFREAIENFEI